MIDFHIGCGLPLFLIVEYNPVKTNSKFFMITRTHKRHQNFSGRSTIAIIMYAVVFFFFLLALRVKSRNVLQIFGL